MTLASDRSDPCVGCVADIDARFALRLCPSLSLSLSLLIGIVSEYLQQPSLVVNDKRPSVMAQTGSRLDIALIWQLDRLFSKRVWRYLHNVPVEREPGICRPSNVVHKRVQGPSWLRGLLRLLYYRQWQWTSDRSMAEQTWPEVEHLPAGGVMCI